MDGKYLYRGPAYIQSLLSVVMIEVEKRGGDETEGIELGVKWVKWVVGEAVLPKCLTLSYVPRVIENSRKFRKLRKSTSSLFFYHSNPNAINVPRLCVK